MPKSKSTIRRHKAELRKIVETRHDDPILRRIAYSMETAISWATSETKNWPSMANEARAEAVILKHELYEGKTK